MQIIKSQIIVFKSQNANKRIKRKNALKNI